MRVQKQGPLNGLELEAKRRGISDSEQINEQAKFVDLR